MYCAITITTKNKYLGHIPGRPLGGRHGMVFGQIPAPPAVGSSTVPLVPGAYRFFLFSLKIKKKKCKFVFLFFFLLDYNLFLLSIDL